MNVAVVGCGSLGGVIAVRLAGRQGLHLQVLNRNPLIAEAASRARPAPAGRRPLVHRPRPARRGSASWPIRRGHPGPEGQRAGADLPGAPAGARSPRLLPHHPERPGRSGAGPQPSGEEQSRSRLRALGGLHDRPRGLPAHRFRPLPAAGGGDPAPAASARPSFAGLPRPALSRHRRGAVVQAGHLGLLHLAGGHQRPALRQAGRRGGKPPADPGDRGRGTARGPVQGRSSWAPSAAD